MSKTVQFQIIQFSIITQIKCKYSLIVKNISISSNSVYSSSSNSVNSVLYENRFLFTHSKMSKLSYVKQFSLV